MVDQGARRGAQSLVCTRDDHELPGEVDALHGQLDQAVADGKLTAAQEATMLADLKSHVDDMVNRSGPPPHGPHGGGPGAPPAACPFAFTG